MEHNDIYCHFMLSLQSSRLLWSPGWHFTCSHVSTLDNTVTEKWKGATLELLCYLFNNHKLMFKNTVFLSSDNCFCWAPDFGFYL